MLTLGVGRRARLGELVCAKEQESCFKLCTDIRWSEKRQNDCFHFALVIDRVILFDSHGAQHKKQLRLAAGKAFDLVQ